MKSILAHILTLTAALMLGSGCTSTGLAPGVATATTVGTSLAVNKYPGAALFVESIAGGIRSVSAKAVPTPEQLASDISPWAFGAETLAGTISAKAKGDVVKFVDAVNARYTAAYPAIAKGDMTVEQFAQAVEAGA